MRVLHICLAAFYIDNFGYQENILPKIHKNQGHKVEIIASTENYLGDKEIGYVKPCTYKNENGIKVTRIGYVKYLPLYISKKIRIYKSLYSKIVDFHPDIIFLHNFQFVSITDVVKYHKESNCKIYIDSHTDYINSAKNWFSENVLHKMVYKWCAKKVEPHTIKFFGTLPIRNDFMENVYKIDSSKIETLEFGFDDSEWHENDFRKIRSEFRKEHHISENEILLFSGGKLDGRKGVLALIKAFSKLNISNIKLIIFGKPTKGIKSGFSTLIKEKNIIYLNWLSPADINRVIISSDLAIFPGTHSVIWEQVIGAGTPAIFKSWKGIRHVDLGGNCIMLDIGSEEEILSALQSIFISKNEKFTTSILMQMKAAAISKRKGRFLYSNIAKRCIS